MAVSKEIKINTPYLEIAAKQWGDPEAPKILALHGWLDNAGSYDFLAPLIKDHCVIAIDLPGHGFSQHRPAGVNWHVIDDVVTVIEILNCLECDDYILLGHSLGAAISCLAAGALQHKLKKLILIEAIGPFSFAKESIVDQFKQYLQERTRLPSRKIPKYKDIQTMIDLRLNFGSAINRDSVEALMQRGIVPLEEGYTWATDPRLKMKTALQMPEDAIQEYLKNITAPTLLIEADAGIFRLKAYFEERKICIKNLKSIVFPGAHHLHMDTPELVADTINQFLIKND